jgi:hypothetical protein
MPGSYSGPTGGTTFGSGIRGGKPATIAAVLLDPEARIVPDLTNPAYGHLHEPVLFITNTLRALGGKDVTGFYTTDFVLGDQFLPSGVSTAQT